MFKQQRSNRQDAGSRNRPDEAIEPDRRLIVAMVAIGMIVGALLSDGKGHSEGPKPVASASIMTD